MFQIGKMMQQSTNGSNLFLATKTKIFLLKSAENFWRRLEVLAYQPSCVCTYTEKNVHSVTVSSEHKFFYHTVITYLRTVLQWLFARIAYPFCKYVFFIWSRKLGTQLTVVSDVRIHRCGSASFWSYPKFDMLKNRKSVFTRMHSFTFLISGIGVIILSILDSILKFSGKKTENIFAWNLYGTKAGFSGSACPGCRS